MDTNEAAPKTLLEAVTFFSKPGVALAYLARMRWPNGPHCPRCGEMEPHFIQSRQLWRCKGCKKQFSVKVGTIMEDSPIHLEKWMAAIWMIANCKNGISSYEIHRALGVTQKSAWFLMHRIRKAMQAGTFRKLAGDVEVDETFIGGLARNMHKNKRNKVSKTGFIGKVAVMGLLERHGGEVRTVIV